MKPDASSSPGRPAPVTLTEVARHAGVSLGAASLALRGQTGVSTETRQRVLQAAAQLGYVPDAAAAALAARRGSGALCRKLRVAYLTAAEPPGQDAFRQACAAFGIEGQRISPRQFPSARVAARALYQQGFAGLILDEPSLWEPAEVGQFSWQKFALVKLSRGRADLPCHVVRHSAFDYMDTTLREVARRGYRRLAVLLYRSICERDNDARLGALLAFAARPRQPQLVCQWRELSDLRQLDPRTVSWLRRFRPDAIVAFHWQLLPVLRSLGYRWPGPVGFAAVLSTRRPPAGLPAISGCDADEQQGMNRAVETLVRLFTHGQRGFPSFPIEHVIEPCWLDGDTLPARGAGKPAQTR